MRAEDDPRTDGRPLFSRSISCMSCPVKGRTDWCVLGEDDLRLVSKAKICNTYEPGQVIFYQGNPCLGIHCIEEGTVALRKTDGRGHAMLARLFHAGDTIGYLAYFSERGYTGTAEALSFCRVCFIDRAAVRTLLGRNPQLGVSFLGRVADNLKEAEDSKLQIVSVPLRARVAHLLLGFKDRFGRATENGGLVIELPLSRSDMAAMVGARPESISRVIRSLTQRRIALFDGRTVRVPDLDLLLDVCEELDAV